MTRLAPSPSTVTRVSALSLLAFSPFVEPTYASPFFASVMMIGLVPPLADVTVPRQFPTTGSRAAAAAGDAGCCVPAVAAIADPRTTTSA